MTSQDGDKLQQTKSSLEHIRYGGLDAVRSVVFAKACELAEYLHWDRREKHLAAAKEEYLRIMSNADRVNETDANRCCFLLDVN